MRSIGLMAAACVLATGCLTATPPKTPNQRAVERAAPRIVPPPPPDAGRHPRPASSPAAPR
jgi:hypothetical protein